MTDARVTTVQNILTHPGTERPWAGRTVSIRLNVPSFIDGGSVEKVGTSYATTDADGLWSVVLEVNDDIDPPGTYYSVREVNSGPLWTFIVPYSATPVTLRSCLVVDPANPDPLVAGVPLPVNETPGYIATVAADGNSIEYDPPAGGGGTVQSVAGVAPVSGDIPEAGLAAALSLSGTNSGDETTSSIKSKLSITTLSGSNTGDQDLSGLATTVALGNEATARANADALLAPQAGPTFTGHVTVPTPTSSTDAATKAYVDGAVTGLFDPRGNYDASVNTFPATGGSGAAGAVVKGDLWAVSVAGTLGGKAVVAGDLVWAVVDAPGQAAGNWNIIEHDLGYTPEDSANKSNDTAFTADSATLYPTQHAVKTALAGKASTLTRQPKTGNYTAVLGDEVAADTTGGTLTVTLPAASGGKGQIVLKWVAGTVPPSVAVTGSDHFDTSGGSTGGSFTLLNQTATYDSDGTSIWTVRNSFALSTLDARYVNDSTVAAKGDLLVGSGAGAVSALTAAADGSILVTDSTQTLGLKYSTVPAPGPTYNLLPQYYKRWRRALSKVRAGTGNAVLFCNGDSTTEGKGSTFQQNYPSILTKLLNQYYVPAAQTWMTRSGPNVIDDRVTLGPNWTNAIFYWYNPSGISDTITFAPSSDPTGPASVDTFDIYSWSGTFSASVNGGATTNWTAGGGSTAVTKTTVTCAAGGSNVLSIVSTNGHVVAVNAYSSTVRQVQVGNLGISGSKTSDWVSNPVGSPFGYANWATNFAPDLTILDLGINDAAISISTSTYSTNFQTVITRGLVPGDMMLKSFVPSNGSPYVTVEPTYIPVLNTLATSNSVALLDVFARWQSYAVSNPLGYYFDALHPSAFGYSDVAQAVFNVLKTL